MRLRLPFVSILALAVGLAGLSATPAASQDTSTVEAATVRAVVIPATGGLSLMQSVDVVDTMDGLGFVTVEATEAELRALEASGAIEGYSIERELSLFLDTSTTVVGADVVNAQGNTGDGKAVAVIDSGVDADHPAFGGRVVAEACFLDNIDSPCPSAGGSQVATGPGTARPCVASGCFHGTHVAGIVASSDAAYPGVAPGVGVVAVRVTSGSGGILSSDVLEALEWVRSVASFYDIAAVNLSLGSDEDPGECRDAPWEAAVTALNDAGVAVIAASGNSADLGLAPVAFPACLPGVISVGATERASFSGLASGTTPELADFSQYAGVLDMVAPGFDITAPVTGTGFASLDGTSMAAPHVAGAFALLADTQNGWTPARFEELLRTTGVMVERYTAAAGDRHDRYPEIRLADAVAFEPFADASSGYWVAAADWAKYTGVSGGIGDNLYGPNGTLNRAQAVTFLWRLIGSPAPSEPSGFSDVPDGEFYTDAVAWAKETGLTTGDGGENTFGPGGVVTRGVMATFLWRFAGEPAGSLGTFPDVPDGAFYEEAVGWMADNGITTGTTPTTFSPNALVNRAQMITFIWRLVNAKDAWGEGVPLPETVMF